MISHIGHWAALLTAFCWTLSAVCFTRAGERVGSLAVNLLRLLVALVLFALYGVLVLGEVVPFSATRGAWFWLTLSGIAGFFVGDLCLFRSFLLIGPRLGMLIMALAPPMTALIGGLALGERLTPANWVGMAVTLAGVMWVITETPAAHGHPEPVYRFNVRGGLLALLGSLGQAAGMVLAKLGLPGVKSPFAATEIRLLGGTACFVLLILALRWHPAVFRALRDRRAMATLGVGAVAGPFLGVTLIMFAIARIPTGLAQTFASLTPVLILPFMAVLYRERISPRALGGALVACAGVALLFVR